MRSTPEGPSLEYGYSAAVILLASRITGNVERNEMAKEVAQKVILCPDVTPHVGSLARVALGLLAIGEANAAEAEIQYTALTQTAGTMLLFPTIAGDRILALLAHTMGNPDAAFQHFEDSLAFCRKAGYRPELAWTCCNYADALFQRASTGLAPTESKEDRAKAKLLLDESLAISSALGMRPLMERVLSRRDILTV